jgi:biotin transport system substrate-specific component
VSSSSPTVAQPRVLTDVIPGDRVRDVVLTLSFTLAIAASAELYFYLPGNPVPITGETFAVLAGAVVLGARRAGVGAALFLVLAAGGVPFFAAFNGATIGYIVGFAVAALLVGAVAQQGYARTPLQVALVMVVGNLIIYVFGAGWLVAATSMNPEFLSAFGYPGAPSTLALIGDFTTPYLIGDAVKIAAAVAVVPTLWRLVGRRDQDA